MINPTPKEFVISHYPKARIVFNQAMDTFKVYDGGPAGIALSASFKFEMSAWADAAEAIKDRESQHAEVKTTSVQSKKK